MMKKLWFYTITLLSLLLAGCNNGDDGLLDIPSGWSHNAESLVVTPKNASVPVGLTQQMHADAILPNSVVVDVTTNEALTWRSSDPTIATVDTQGLVKGVEVGTVTITAEGVNNDGSVVKDTATLTVTNAEVVNLLVTPEVDTTVVGLTKPFKATAILSTGATQDVTNEAALSWTSSNTDIATIDANGIATGLAVGEVTITATGTIGGSELSDTATLTVTNAEVVNLLVTPEVDTTVVGLTKPFKATAILSTGATQDVTNEAALSWTSSNTDIATIDANGIATGLAVGEVTITATGTIGGNELSDTATLTVTNAEVVNLLVTPEVDTTVVGLTKPFKATAILSTGATQDVTNEAALSWTSSNTDIATIDANGIATGLAVGEVTITATGTIGGNELSDTATLTVTNAEVVNLLVTPEVDTTVVGLTKPFKATAILSTGATQDVTNEAALSWTSSNTDIATIDANGIATGLAVGEVTITATGTIGGSELSDTSTLTVIGTRKIVQVNSKSITEDNPLYFQDIPLGNGITELERFDFLQVSLYEVISQDEAKIRRDTVCKLFIDKDHYLDIESNTLKPLDELSTIVEIQERDGLTEGNEFNIAFLFTRFGSVPYIRFRFEFNCEGTLLEAFSNIYYAPDPS
ncbi:Ig-like domain-containing protein [Vibrio parahaemolyticus]